jgi:RHS repeat-associated protein
MPTALGFTGQRLDANVGLLYYRARYYDPGLGRFIQPDTTVPDPGNPQNLNPYGYVLNNPLKHVDPSGQCIPGENCPGDMGDVYVPPAHYALTKEPKKYVQSQGKGTNDCGPTSVAMGINLALGQPGAFTKDFVTDFMNQPELMIDPFSGAPIGSGPKYRWAFGATLPVQARDAINDLAKEYNLPLHAESKVGTLEDLKSNLQKGYPTLVCVVWDDPTQAHWMVLEGYDEATDTWTFLDPDPNVGIREWTTQEFRKYWDRPYLYVDFFFHNKMVTIVVEGPVPSIE